jgi:hypothetical protein
LGDITQATFTLAPAGRFGSVRLVRRSR